MYVRYITNKKPLLSFSKFINEANNESLEKDSRIVEIVNLIKADMLKTGKLKGSVDAQVIPKSKNPVKKPITINWEFDVIFQTKKPDEFCTGTRFMQYGDIFSIYFDVHFADIIDTEYNLINGFIISG